LASFDVQGYVRIFNAAVDTGAWTTLAEQFADDATLEFVGPQVGPFTGRAAILEAYTRDPPDDKIEIGTPVSAREGEWVAPFRWVSTGATGSMHIVERGGRIVRLVVTFD
jgi:hypothetical protein